MPTSMPRTDSTAAPAAMPMPMSTPDASPAPATSAAPTMRP
jgi:hypothetical protein